MHTRERRSSHLLNTASSPSSRPQLVALVALFLGLLLLDRGFTDWRNNRLNFPDAYGRYPNPDPGDPPLGYVEAHHLSKPLMYTGTGLIGLSILLFSLPATTRDT